jgi:hypothetical protein
MPSKPGQATMLWLHFGITASAIISSFGGLLPIPFGLGPVLAQSATQVQTLLTRKETDQENSMK